MVKTENKDVYLEAMEKTSARYRNLKMLGIPSRKAWEWANTRKGYWHIANSFILSRSLTNEYLTARIQ